MLFQSRIYTQITQSRHWRCVHFVSECGLSISHSLSRRRSRTFSSNCRLSERKLLPPLSKAVKSEHSQPSSLSGGTAHIFTQGASRDLRTSCSNTGGISVRTLFSLSTTGPISIYLPAQRALPFYISRENSFLAALPRDPSQPPIVQRLQLAEGLWCGNRLANSQSIDSTGKLHLCSRPWTHFPEAQ